MNNGQFKAAVEEATRVIQEDGWKDADFRAVLLFGLGHLDSRAVRLDGKLALTSALVVGGLIGGAWRALIL